MVKKLSQVSDESSNANYDQLADAHDQLRKALRLGNGADGFREEKINFQPTYRHMVCPSDEKFIILGRSRDLRPPPGPFMVRSDPIQGADTVHQQILVVSEDHLVRSLPRPRRVRPRLHTEATGAGIQAMERCV